MKTFDYWASVALGALLSRDNVAHANAVEDSIDIARMMVAKLCETQGHDYDVPGEVGRCTRCDHLKNGKGHL